MNAGVGLRLRVWTIAVILLVPSLAYSADEPNGVEASGGDRSRGGEIFEGGGLGLEFAFGVLGEAWNLNDRREWLTDGSAAVWWTFTNRVMLVTEFHAMRVFQEPSRPAFVIGFTPVVRWRVVEPGQWKLFAELGPGISWSDTPVPPRGTQFNYLLVAGAGLTRRIGGQTHAIISGRWVHLSNNGREGRGRNPDIEAIGGYGGIALAF